jgi:hypothetical protein
MLHGLAAQHENLARVRTLLQGFRGYTRGCTSAPPQECHTHREGKKVLPKASTFAESSDYPCKDSVATVGDSHRGPLTMGEITLSKK